MRKRETANRLAICNGQSYGTTRVDEEAIVQSESPVLSWPAISPTVAIAIVLFAHTVAPRAGSVPAVRADASAASSELTFQVSFGPELSKTPLDGRLLVILSTDHKEEPRFQINESPKTQQIFGIDVDGMAARTRRHY